MHDESQEQASTKASPDSSIGPTRLPAGPPGSWRPTLQLIRNPRAALEGWAQTYGDPFLLNALNGPVVVTGREDLIRTIHGQDPNIYAPFATATIEPLIGGGSMLILQGDAHRRERRLMTPMFHGDRMKAYGLSMQQSALEQFAAHQSTGRIVALDLMTAISLEVIVRTIFGGSNRDLTDKLMDASRTLVAKSHPLLFFSRRMHLPFFGFSPWDRYIAAKKHLFELLDEVITQRQSQQDAGDDILALLCQATYEDGQKITRDHIYAELLTFLFAGHETTALSMTWAIYHLHRHPAVLKRLREELDALPDDSPTSLTSSAYLKAIVQETLRIHPIVTETLRKLKAPLQLGEFVIPIGTAVAPATVLAHHNPKTYPDPELFRPERFLERSYSPFEYMPFGGGHRRCIGAAFATYEMTIVLGTLLRRFEMELIDSAPVVPKRRSVTIGPSTGVPIRVIGPRK